MMKQVFLQDGVIDFLMACVNRGEEVIPLTSIEVRLLTFLVSRPGEFFTPEILLKEVWDASPKIESHAPRHAVFRLRKKLEKIPEKPTILVGSQSRGYSYIPFPGSFNKKEERPSRTQDFFGREKELETLFEWWSGSEKIFAVFGPGGVGKSRLTYEFSRSLEVKTIHVHLDGSSRPEQACAAICQAANAEPPQGNLFFDTANAITAAQISLLILHSVEAVAPNLEFMKMLESLIDIKVLFTSQILFSNYKNLVLSPFSLEEAREFFLRKIDSSLKVEISKVDTVVESLEFMPLGIELAASRASVFSLDQIIRQLETTNDLTDISDQKNPRHGSVLKAIQWIWNLISSEDQEFLVRTTLFPDTISSELAEGLFGEGSTDRMLRLSKAHLIAPVGQGRFRVRPPVRRFVVKNSLQKKDDLIRIVSYCMSHLSNLVEGSKAWFAWVSDERPLLEFCITLPDTKDLVIHLAYFHYFRREFRRVMELLEQDLPPHLFFRGKCLLAEVMFMRAGHTQANQILDNLHHDLENADPLSATWYWRARATQTLSSRGMGEKVFFEARLALQNLHPELLRRSERGSILVKEARFYMLKALYGKCLETIEEIKRDADTLFQAPVTAVEIIVYHEQGLLQKAQAIFDTLDEQQKSMLPLSLHWKLRNWDFFEKEISYPARNQVYTSDHVTNIVAYFILKDDIQGAKKYLSQTLISDPWYKKTLGFQVLEAVLYREEGNFQEAEVCFKEMIKDNAPEHHGMVNSLRPRYPLYELTYTYFLQRKWEEALELAIPFSKNNGRHGLFWSVLCSFAQSALGAKALAKLGICPESIPDIDFSTPIVPDLLATTLSENALRKVYEALQKEIEDLKND